MSNSDGCSSTSTTKPARLAHSAFLYSTFASMKIAGMKSRISQASTDMRMNTLLVVVS